MIPQALCQSYRTRGTDALDLSVEFFVLLPEYESLFSEGERAEAKRRLAAYGFQSGHPPAH